MADLSLAQRSDAELETVLSGFADEIAWPTATTVAGGPDVAATVRMRIVAERRVGSAGRAAGRGRWGLSLRPMSRALLVALIVLLALAALAGAAGLGLPGLRILLGGPGPDEAPSPSPGASSAVVAPSGRPSPAIRPTPRPTPVRTATPGPPGSGLGLGTLVAPAVLDEVAGFHVILPTDPAIGPPDAIWIDPAKNDQVTLVWAPSPTLTETGEPGVGLLVTEFRGTVDDGYFTKIVREDTTVTLVEVDGERGYWLSGDPHMFFYEGSAGFVEDGRRWVGDVLLWADGPITHRLETALGPERAIDIAESMR
jgi:hypothetical protein